MIVVGIDSGTTCIGYAITQDGILIDCGASKSRADHLADKALEHATRIGYVDHAYVESMVDTGGKRRTTSQDLIDVQAVSCLVGAWCAPRVTLLKPSDWKGSIPKDIHHVRIRDVLDAYERAIADTAAKAAGARNAKEVWDAIGIALYAGKRINRSGGARR